MPNGPCRHKESVKCPLFINCAFLSHYKASHRPCWGSQQKCSRNINWWWMKICNFFKHNMVLLSARSYHPVVALRSYNASFHSALVGSKCSPVLGSFNIVNLPSNIATRKYHFTWRGEAGFLQTCVSTQETTRSYHFKQWLEERLNVPIHETEYVRQRNLMRSDLNGYWHKILKAG